MKFSEAEKYLANLEMFGIKLGLDQVAELLASVGAPHRRLRFIHIAGTNGKGSVCTMLERMLMAAGFKVGLYTSPHLISVRERFKINGKVMAAATFAALVSELRPGAERMRAANRLPTYFEFTTALAALYFARNEVDFVVWETGLGGRFDATNIVIPICSVITNISFDHQQYLGDTIEKIAAEKAGIIKSGVPVFCGKMAPAARAVIGARAKRLNGRLIDADSPEYGVEKRQINVTRFSQSFQFKGMPVTLALPGRVQTENAQLALAVMAFLAESFGFALERALKGLARVKMPARTQVLPDGRIVDGGHNPAGAEALRCFLEEYFPTKKFTVVFANFADKDTRQILRILAAVAAEFVFVPLEISPRRKGYSGAELLEIHRQLGLGIPARAADSVAELVRGSSSSRLLFTGSLYLAGQVLKLLKRL